MICYEVVVTAETILLRPLLLDRLETTYTTLESKSRYTWWINSKSGTMVLSKQEHTTQSLHSRTMKNMQSRDSRRWEGSFKSFRLNVGVNNKVNKTMNYV